MFNASHAVGESPGYCGFSVTAVYAPVPSMQTQLGGCVHERGELSPADCDDASRIGTPSHSEISEALRMEGIADSPVQSQITDRFHERDNMTSVDADLANSIAAPTVSEMCEALRMGGTVDMSSSEDCFRVLFFQNSVIIREAIVNRLMMSKKSSGISTFSSLSGSGESSGRASVGSQKRTKESPPKVFCCPVCPAVLNEKDFGRHIRDWVEKVGKVAASGHCPGIQDANHPLLSKFGGGTVKDRVSACSAYIKSFVHPGAYDASSAAGSGRHITVAQRIAELLRP